MIRNIIVTRTRCAEIPTARYYIEFPARTEAEIYYFILENIVLGTDD